MPNSYLTTSEDGIDPMVDYASSTSDIEQNQRTAQELVNRMDAIEQMIKEKSKLLKDLKIKYRQLWRESEAVCKEANDKSIWRNEWQERALFERSGELLEQLRNMNTRQIHPEELFLSKLEDMRTDLQPELDTVLTRYHDATRRPVMNELQNQFPLELRDWVYQAMGCGQGIIHVEAVQTPAGGYKVQYNVRGNLAERQYWATINSDAVPRSMAAEMLRVLYNSWTFNVSSDHVVPFSQYNLLRLGLRPLGLIRRLNVMVAPGNYQDNQRRAQLTGSLRALHQTTRSNAQINIEFDFQQWDITELRPYISLVTTNPHALSPGAFGSSNDAAGLGSAAIEYIVLTMTSEIQSLLDSGRTVRLVDHALGWMYVLGPTFSVADFLATRRKRQAAKTRNH